MGIATGEESRVQQALFLMNILEIREALDELKALMPTLNAPN